ncbi:response regulator transcription factor [Nevskia soli]|uniref:response regulator transcription factor n=1 Tax=Nevskia soli TaxID=418856 RepID=UPI0004A6DA0E|nr:response regulator transcription factor [Nevskia soli]
MSPDAQTVFVVDDDKSLRDSLRWLLESIRLQVETFDSAESFIGAFDPLRSGCLVLDVRMPGLSGPELMDRLNRLGSSLPIIFLSAHGDVPLAVRAMKGGAVDFLQKPYNNQLFIERVREALDRDLRQRQERRRHDGVSASLAALSERERQVLERVVAGKSNKVIARELDISHKTVEAHRSRLMQKMGASSFAELLQMVLTGGEQAA